MSYFTDLSEVEEQQMPGRRRKVIAGERVMLVFVEREAGTAQEHVHESEQIVHLIEGRARFTVAGEAREVRGGQVVRIPAGAPHGLEALTPITYVGIYSPPREAVIRGEA